MRTASQSTKDASQPCDESTSPKLLTIMVLGTKLDHSYPIVQHLGKSYDPSKLATSGVDIVKDKLKVAGQEVTVHLWFTGAYSQTSSITKNYLKQIDGVIYCSPNGELDQAKKNEQQILAKFKDVLFKAPPIEIQEQQPREKREGSSRKAGPASVTTTTSMTTASTAATDQTSASSLMLNQE